MSCIPCILKMKLAHEISSGMSYLHGVNIIHCDLKLQNVLIGEQISAKISDFGLSKWKDYSRSHTNAGMIQGTPSHISPEQWSDPNYRPNEKTDVYSFSTVLWEMFTEKQAYEGARGMICERVMSGRRLSLDVLPRNVPEEIHYLIQGCWDKYSACRPSFREIAIILRSFVYEPTKEKEMKNAKEIVLTTYYRRSGTGTISVSDLDDADHSQKINRAHQTLCEFIRHPDQILSSLFQKKAVTQQERELIKSEKNIYKWTRCLLEVLSVKPASAYQYFLEILDATNQHHLYLLLEEKENITLSHSGLLDTLLESDVLDQQEVTEIRSKSTDHKRTDQLLQCILRTSQEQYQLFLDALKTCCHEHVYIKMKGADVTVVDKEMVNFSYIKINRDQANLDLTNFLKNSSVPYIYPPSGESLTGITVLGGEVFVVRDTSQVFVYNSTDFSLSQTLVIFGSHQLTSIVSCFHHSCLYLCDSESEQEVIHRYDLSNKTTTQWPMRGKCYGLFVTKCYNVLVTFPDTKQIHEYVTSGQLIREINFDTVESSIDGLWHCVELSTGNFVICCDNSIAIVDSRGRRIQSYEASDHGQLITPHHMAVDKHDNVLVADYTKNAVHLLSSKLAYLGEVEIPGHKLDEPITLHFDERNCRLYIGEATCDGRIFVLDAEIKDFDLITFSNTEN